MGVEYDEQLSQQLRDLAGRGGTAKLADLTDFTWDTVHVFSEGTTASEVEQVSGESVLNDNRYYDAGNLLVFVDDGHVVAALSVLPGLLVTAGQPTWDADTILEPHGARIAHQHCSWCNHARLSLVEQVKVGSQILEFLSISRRGVARLALRPGRAR